MITGSAASLLSTAVIMRRSQRDSGNLWCGTNATSHWVWGERALHQHGRSLRYTVLGYAIHHLCSIFWGGIYEAWLERRPGGQNRSATHCRTASKAATVAVLAAAVDYTVTPQRLTPGFERHLSLRSMGWVYLAFGVGLACTTCCLSRR